MRLQNKVLSGVLVIGILFGVRIAQAQQIDVNEFVPLPKEEKSSGWDNGFYIRSKDDNFKMKVGGKVQVQQDTEVKSGLQKQFDPATKRFTTPDKFSDTFLVRRASIQTSGTIYNKVDWATTFTIGTAAPGKTANVKVFADVTYNVSPYLYFDMGSVSLPMDRDISSSWILGVEAPITATQEDGIKQLTIARQSFGPGPDLGVVVGGEAGRFSYSVGVVNGSGPSNLNADDNVSTGGRIQLDVLGKSNSHQTDFAWSEKPNLSFGLGSAWEDENTPDDFVPTIMRKWDWTSSVDTAFKYRGFALNGAVYYRKLKYTGGILSEDTNKDGFLIDKGYYANAGYYAIPKKLEFQINGAQIFREGPDNDAYEFGGGLNWYIHNNNVKLQVDYSRVLDFDATPGLNNAVYNRFRTMFSLIL